MVIFSVVSASQEPRRPELVAITRVNDLKHSRGCCYLACKAVIPWGRTQTFFMNRYTIIVISPPTFNYIHDMMRKWNLFKEEVNPLILNMKIQIFLSCPIHKFYY